MLVLANEMFDSPPVFAWVLPVFVRLQPGKEETFFSASRSRIFCFLFEVRVKANAMFSYALIQSTAYELQSRPRFSSTRVSPHSRMEGGTSTVVSGLPTTTGIVDLLKVK